MKYLKVLMLISLVFGMMLVTSSMAPQLGYGQSPVIKRLGTFRGDEFASFAEFRVQQVEFDDTGVMRLLGVEPHELLVNINYITTLHRYEDVKGKDYSSLMYFTFQKNPVLVRMEYKDIITAIRRAAEAQTR